jgi:hypothetical protein
MAVGFPSAGYLGHFIPSFLPGPGGVLYALILLVVALALIFAGRWIIKALAFLAVGLAGAAFGAVVGSVILGLLGTIIGGVLGFVVGGLIGLLLVHIGIGLALGYFGYLITSDLTHIFLVAVIVGVLLFVVGVIVTSRLLELATAILGGVILYGVLTFFGIASLFAVPIALVVSIIGFYVQHSRASLAPSSR